MKSLSETLTITMAQGIIGFTRVQYLRSMLNAGQVLPKREQQLRSTHSSVLLGTLWSQAPWVLPLSLIWAWHWLLEQMVVYLCSPMDDFKEFSSLGCELPLAASSRRDWLLRLRSAVPFHAAGAAADCNACRCAALLHQKERSQKFPQL